MENKVGIKLIFWHFNKTIARSALFSVIGLLAVWQVYLQFGGFIMYFGDHPVELRWVFNPMLIAGIAGAAVRLLYNLIRFSAIKRSIMLGLQTQSYADKLTAFEKKNTELQEQLTVTEKRAHCLEHEDLPNCFNREQGLLNELAAANQRADKAEQELSTVKEDLISTNQDTVDTAAPETNFLTLEKAYHSNHKDLSSALEREQLLQQDLAAANQRADEAEQKLAQTDSEPIEELSEDDFVEEDVTDPGSTPTPSS